MHGGKSPGAGKGNKNRTLHGIYSRFYSDEESAALDEVKLGEVDAELKLCRVRLLRAMEAEQRSKEQPELVETVVRKGAGDGPSGEKRYRRTDYGHIIDRLMGRIESLERTRKELMKDAGDDEPQESVSVTIERKSARRQDADPQ
jgi:hypothetical protein